MNDQTSYTISFYWPKKEEKGTQWIVGTEVGYPPTSQTALEYPACKTGMGLHQCKELMSWRIRNLTSTFLHPLILKTLHIGNPPQTKKETHIALLGI